MLNATGYGYFQVSILADFFFSKETQNLSRRNFTKNFFLIKMEIN